MTFQNNVDLRGREPNNKIKKNQNKNKKNQSISQNLQQ